MHVTGLNIYPVKSGRAIVANTATVMPMGLRHDRQWMIIDENGTFLTQRDTPHLAQLITEVDDTGGLTLTVAGEFQHTVPLPDVSAQTVTVRVWKSTLAARRTSDSVSQKLSAWLGKSVQLVRFPESGARTSNPVWAGPDVPVGFADAYPVLIALTESLDELNARLVTALPMERFRPNIIISGAPAWADDVWRHIRIGAVELELVKPSDRCLVTTTDQTTGVRTGPEPLALLAKIRRSAVAGVNGVLFGTNAVPRICGDIRVGDSVEVLESRVPWKIMPEKQT